MGHPFYLVVVVVAKNPSVFDKKNLSIKVEILALQTSLMQCFELILHTKYIKCKYYPVKMLVNYKYNNDDFGQQKHGLRLCAVRKADIPCN